MNEVEKTLATAKAAGMTVYMVDGCDTFGFIVTPNGNVIDVNKASWKMGEFQGVTFGFAYKPNRKCGSACSCMDKGDYDFGVRNVTAEDILEYEKAGLKYATELKAPRYSSVAEWYAEKDKGVYKGKIKEV